jgi:bifunctional DNA-binding transcriptional regulator/antitoxin component of YhaV-PrlF toxin-antitoxin module
MGFVLLKMATAKVDDRGRIKLPSDLVLPGEMVVIINADSYFLGIPIPRDPLMSSGSWLKRAEDVKELKRTAEEKAREDAVGRANRRKQSDD